MSKHIALVETAEDVEEILMGLPKYQIDSSQVSWLPVEIEADLMLRERGIKPINTAELLSIGDRKNIFVDAVDWSHDWLNGSELNRIDLGIKNDFTISDFLKDNIYFFFDHLFYLIAIIEGVIKQENPANFLVSTKRPEIVQGIDHTKEYYLRRVSKLVANNHNISVQEIDVVSGLIAGKKGKTLIQKVKNRISKLILNKLGSHHRGPITLAESIKKKIDGKRLLILGGGISEPYWRLEPLYSALENGNDCQLIPLYYSKDPYCPEKKGISLSHKREQFRKSDVYKKLQKRTKEFLDNENLLNGLIYRGYDLSDFCNQKLIWIIDKYLPEYWIDVQIISKKMSEYDFDLLIGSAVTSGNPSFFAALNLFNENNIPTLLIPHGVQFCRYSDNDKLGKYFNFISPLYYSQVAVVGKYSHDTLIASGIINNKNIRYTGNLETLKLKKINSWGEILARKILRLSPQKKTIVYLIGRATRNFHMNYINITFDEVRESISDVIKVANALNCQLVIKPHPNFYKAKDWISSWAPKGDYQIVLDQFMNPALLSIADVTIASKSSMAIEAMDYGTPIVIFEHEPREIHFFEDLAFSTENAKDDKHRPFIRATGYEELLRTCDLVLGDNGFSKKIQEKYRSLVPWIHNNRDGQQVMRMAEFIADITEDF